MYLMAVAMIYSPEVTTWRGLWGLYSSFCAPVRCTFLSLLPQGL